MTRNFTERQVKMTKESCRELFNINIDKELPITLEKHIQGKEISIGEEKVTSVLDSDIVKPSIDKETMAKTFANAVFADENYEQMALNNFKKELFFEIKQYLSISESSKKSGLNYIIEYLENLKDQIVPLK